VCVFLLWAYKSCCISLTVYDNFSYWRAGDGVLHLRHRYKWFNEMLSWYELIVDLRSVGLAIVSIFKAEKYFLDSFNLVYFKNVINVLHNWSSRRESSRVDSVIKFIDKSIKDERLSGWWQFWSRSTPVLVKCLVVALVQPTAWGDTQELQIKFPMNKIRNY